MHFQKFVAWEKLPSLLPKPDESSSSASHSGSSGEEEDDNFNDKYRNTAPKVESQAPAIEVPASVKNVLIKLDTSQLERAKKFAFLQSEIVMGNAHAVDGECFQRDACAVNGLKRIQDARHVPRSKEISKKLFHILDNVNKAYERYKKGEEFDPKLEKEYLLTPTWQEKNRRSRLMDEVDDVLDDSVLKVHELEMVLQSLRVWNEMLTKIEQQKEDIRIAAPVDEMGERLFKFIDYIDANVQHLFKICYSFSEQKTRTRRKSVTRVSMFKAWKEKVAENPKEGEPMTPEEMLESEPLAFTRSQEVTSLIQELADSSVFNKAESIAIKYILNMVMNLIKAFAILARQCRSLKIKCENLEGLEIRKPEAAVSQLQRELRIVTEKKAALEMQVQTVEERCKVLLTTNEVLQKELRDTHEKVSVTKATFVKPPSEKAAPKPPMDTSKKKEEKTVPKEQRTARTAKSEGKSRVEEKPEQGPKPEDSTKEKLPVVPETEALPKQLVPQDSRMKVDTKLQGKDASPKQATAKISSQKLQAKPSRKDLSVKPAEEVVISDATTTGDMKSLDTEPAQEGAAEKARGPADKIKALQDAKGDSKLEEKKKLQKLQIKRPKRSKEKDLASSQSLDESPSSSFYDTSSEEEPSPSPSRESARAPSGTEVVEPPKKELTPLPEQPVAAPPPRIQEAETTLQDKESLKPVPEDSVEDTRERKTVKFQDAVEVESSLTAPAADEIRDAEVPGPSPSQQLVPERAEVTAVVQQDAAETEAQEVPMGKLKEIKEKKEIKDVSRVPAGVPQPKLPERTGSIVRSLSTKLQELAWEKGGVLDAEAIKEFFEELDITPLHPLPGQLERDLSPKSPLPGDRIIPKIPPAKRPPLPPFAAVQAQKKEKSKPTPVEEEPPGEDVGLALQEFQAAILASLADKMSKFKKSPSAIGKRPAKFQPTDPHVQHVFKVVDRKLEECFSLMKKYLTGLKQRGLTESTPSKRALPEREEKVMKVTESSSFDLSHRLSGESSSSSFRLSGDWDQTSEHILPSKLWQQPTSEHDMKPKELRMAEEESQDEPEDQLQLQEEAISSDEEEDEQFLVSHLPDEVDEEESLDQERQEEENQGEAGLLPEAREEKPFPKQKRLQQMEAAELEEMQVQTEEKDQEQQALYVQLQESLLEEEARLLDERQRLDEEAQYLEHMRELFEVQLQQWEDQQQQRQEQEQLWQVQLAHWQELQQEQEAQEQHWVVQRERQKEQQSLMQAEVERMERLHKEHLQRQGEEAKEEWQWEQLKAVHREQQRQWQAEDVEQVAKQWEWQQQLADHEEKMEALQKDYLEQEQKQKNWLQEQEEAQKEQEHLWEKRWTGQLKRWRHQLQKQRAQQRNLLNMLEKGRKLQERHAMRQVLKEETPLPRVVKMVQGTALEQIPLQQKIVLLRRDGQVPVTPQLTPKPSGDFEDSSGDLDPSWFPKLSPKAEMTQAPAVTEKRYWMDVKAQRKNLELLREALLRAELSADLYNKAKGMIKQALQSNAERLAVLFQKYITLYHLQDVRRNLTAQLDLAKYAKDGNKMKDLYKKVDKLDVYYKVVLERWTVKQIAMEKKHQRYLEKMIAAFAQLRLTNKIPLISPCPLLIKAADRTKGTISMPHIGTVLQKSNVYPSPLITVKKPQNVPYSTVVREPSGEQIESLWKTDITELSIPVGPKTPVTLLWSEACGYPDIPRLLELDIRSVRSKPLQEVKTRVQHIPRWKITGYNFMHL